MTNVNANDRHHRRPCLPLPATPNGPPLENLCIKPATLIKISFSYILFVLIMFSEF
uniref:Uncharacterized protein n=1 Tax=Arundo donax TaxID=35708 RepID=A0A0A9C201_ARUDO